MSRTYRRKGYNYNGNRNSFDHEKEKDEKRTARWAEFWAQRGYPVRSDKTDDRAWRRWNDPRLKEVHYHADNHSGRYCVPHWYCVLKYHDQVRSYSKMDIRQGILLDDWDERIIGARAEVNKSLGWMWW